MSADWDIVFEPEIEAVVNSVVWDRYGAIIDYVGHDAGWATSDLEAEAYAIIATNADIVRDYLSNGSLGFLHTWLTHRMIDVTRKDVRRAQRTVSYGVVPDA